MSSVVLTGDTSGSGTITVPAVAGTFTATMGSATGTHFPFTAGTAVASTSGTSIDFTSIPSWVKRITVMFSGVSTNGTSNVLFQLGTSGGVQTTGYLGTSGYVGGTPAATNPTTGFSIYNDTATDVMNGSIIFSQLSSASNIWVAQGIMSTSTRAFSLLTSGSVTLSGTLDRVRITTASGTPTFDAGSINILYE